MTKPKTFTDETIPSELWKHPIGPYRKAPEEFGGEWWMTNPFYGEEPWTRFVEPTPVTLPDGFAEIFGEEPQFTDFPDSRAWTTARNHWEQNLKQFRGKLKPPVSPEALADIENTYAAWGMGRPRFYAGRYAEMVRWPDSQVQDFEAGAFESVTVPHHVIARYQIALVGSGVEIPAGSRHPFVPPHLFAEEE